MKRKYEKIAFVGGLLIDGTGAPAVKNSLVLVDEGKIVYAGANDRPYEGYEVRDITGKTIMPGLVDSHLHFCGNLTGNDTEWVTEPNDQKTVVAVQQAHDCLESGITTVGELHMFVEKVGISEMDTIVAATSNGAKVLRVYDKTGSLEAGKSADLLIINGNPLENIRAIAQDNMELIMKEGEIVRR